MRLGISPGPDPSRNEPRRVGLGSARREAAKGFGAAPATARRSHCAWRSCRPVRAAPARRPDRRRGGTPLGVGQDVEWAVGAVGRKSPIGGVGQQDVGHRDGWGARSLFDPYGEHVLAGRGPGVAEFAGSGPVTPRSCWSGPPVGNAPRAVVRPSASCRARTSSARAGPSRSCDVGCPSAPAIRGVDGLSQRSGRTRRCLERDSRRKRATHTDSSSPTRSIGRGRLRVRNDEPDSDGHVLAVGDNAATSWE